MRIFRTIAFALTCIVFVYGVHVVVKKSASTTFWKQPEVAKETWKVIPMEVTAYCPCESCCGEWSDGHFADGSEVGGKAIAADTTHYTMGTTMDVPWYGIAVVKDRGGVIKGKNRLDLYFSTHQAALVWGLQFNVNVKVRN